MLTRAREAGVELNEERLGINEIIDNMGKNRAIIALLDWNVIIGEKGYLSHFVPLVSYDRENIYVHNHGFDDTKKYMPINKRLFNKARKAKGTDEDILIIYGGGENNR